MSFKVETKSCGFLRKQVPWSSEQTQEAQLKKTFIESLRAGETK